MATKSTSLSAMVFFFAFTFLLFASSQLVFSYEDKVPQSLVITLPPSNGPLAELKNFVAKCGANLSRNCGTEIRNELLEVENVSGYCCGQLVKMGLICHKAMTRLAVELNPPLFNEGETATVMSNSVRVYNRCAKTVNNTAPSPY